MARVCGVLFGECAAGSGGDGSGVKVFITNLKLLKGCKNTLLDALSQKAACCIGIILLIQKYNKFCTKL